MAHTRPAAGQINFTCPPVRQQREYPTITVYGFPHVTGRSQPDIRPAGDASRENIKSSSPNGELLLAADEGFEPSQTESESGVLPLHKSAKRKQYYTRFSAFVNTF